MEIECITSKGGSKKSLECSIGSADSLDRMSTLSSSSRGSNKMLNMEEVEAIAEKQEQSKLTTQWNFIIMTSFSTSNCS